jgi:hypothetical protein
MIAIELSSSRFGAQVASARRSLRRAGRFGAQVASARRSLRRAWPTNAPGRDRLGSGRGHLAPGNVIFDPERVNGRPRIGDDRNAQAVAARVARGARPAPLIPRAGCSIERCLGSPRSASTCSCDLAARPASICVGQFVVSAVAQNIQSNLGIGIGVCEVEVAV